MLHAVALVLALVAHAEGVATPETASSAVCPTDKPELEPELEPVLEPVHVQASEHVVPLCGQMATLGVSTTVTLQNRSEAAGAACLERVLALNQVRPP